MTDGPDHDSRKEADMMSTNRIRVILAACAVLLLTTAAFAADGMPTDCKPASSCEEGSKKCGGKAKACADACKDKCADACAKDGAECCGPDGVCAKGECEHECCAEAGCAKKACHSEKAKKGCGSHGQKQGCGSKAKKGC